MATLFGRITITLESDVLAYARRRAKAEGRSLSAWLNRLAERHQKVTEGLAAMNELWAATGPPTPDEKAWAARVADAIEGGVDQETLDRIWAEFPDPDGGDRATEAA